MAASAEQIERVRKMVNERDDTNYADDEIQAIIESYPLTDAWGFGPDDPTEIYTVNPDWTPTYDLNAAAAEIWEQKAGALAGDFDFSADGASYNRSQAYEQTMRQARHYRAKRSPKTMHMTPAPRRPLLPEELEGDESN